MRDQFRAELSKVVIFPRRLLLRESGGPPASESTFTRSEPECLWVMADRRSYSRMSECFYSRQRHRTEGPLRGFLVGSDQIYSRYAGFNVESSPDSNQCEWLQRGGNALQPGLPSPCVVQLLCQTPGRSHSSCGGGGGTAEEQHSSYNRGKKMELGCAHQAGL